SSEVETSRCETVGTATRFDSLTPVRSASVLPVHVATPQPLHSGGGCAPFRVTPQKKKRPRRCASGTLCQTARIIGSLSCSTRRDSRCRQRNSLCHWAGSSLSSSKYVDRGAKMENHHRIQFPMFTKSRSAMVLLLFLGAAMFAAGPPPAL